MSYLTYALLTEDVNFGRRSRSCIIQQANAFTSDANLAVVALAGVLLKGYPAQTQTMLQGIAAGPGFDTTVDNGDGTIDETKLTDNQLLAQCQEQFPIVASLYFDSTGAPIA
jgi:hypothetical protein